LGIDARLTHPAGNQLCHLAAEIDDQNGIGEMRRVHVEALVCHPRAVNRANTTHNALLPPWGHRQCSPSLQNYDWRSCKKGNSPCRLRICVIECCAAQLCRKTGQLGISEKAVEE